MNYQRMNVHEVIKRILLAATVILSGSLGPAQRPDVNLLARQGLQIGCPVC